MDITQVDAQKMDALKALSETNLKVSDARVNLANLKEEEGQFIKERENNAVKRVQEIFEESRLVLNEAAHNYQMTTELASTTTDFSSFLLDAYDKFKDIRTSFAEHRTKWEEEVKKREEQLGELKKHVEVDRKLVETSKGTIEKALKSLEVERKKIDDDRQTLARATERLKQNRI